MKQPRLRFLIMAKVSRLLAVDASVLRGAGDKAGHSAHCASVLNAILEICHRAVFCIEIQTEWNKHQSRMATKWRASMNARKKLIRVDIERHRKRISDQVDCIFQTTTAHRAALTKDVHLLAAAAQADRVIVSGDQALKDLCSAYLQENIEWLLVLPNDEAAVRQLTIDRLLELSKASSNVK